MFGSLSFIFLKIAEKYPSLNNHSLSVGLSNKNGIS
jgi:hypothetical protein